MAVSKFLNVFLSICFSVVRVRCRGYYLFAKANIWADLATIKLCQSVRLVNKFQLILLNDNKIQY